MIDKIFVKRCIGLLKCLVASYVITGIMLVMIAGGLYKFSLSENIIDIAIILAYCISSMAAGFLFAKGAGGRRFVWGALAGMMYFLVICAISVLVVKDFEIVSNSCITTLGICLISGMIGGMVS